jgi:hypothetical protein
MSLACVSMLFVIADPATPLTLDFDGRQAMAQELKAGVRVRLEGSLTCATALWRLSSVSPMTALRDFGCASVGELGERFGLSAADARELMEVGGAFARNAEFERLVRDGSISLDAACSIARVFLSPWLMREDDDWFHWARTETVAALRSRVRKRLEEAQPQPGPVQRIELFVKSSVNDAWRRARRIASQKARHPLTPGQAFGTIVEHYLDDHDPQRVKPGSRRVPDTVTVAGRYVPVEVQREIFARQHERCAVPFCDHEIFLEMAHIVSHATGGSREADNLIILCSRHHAWYDAGYLWMTGSLDAPDFFDDEDRDLAFRFCDPQTACTGPPREGSP